MEGIDKAIEMGYNPVKVFKLREIWKCRFSSSFVFKHPLQRCQWLTAVCGPCRSTVW